MGEIVWCKTLQEENFERGSQVGEIVVLLEPAHRRNGKLLLNLNGLPQGRPSWEVGEKVVLYVGDGIRRFAALVEIVRDPRPSTAKDRWDECAWPWATNAEVLGMMVDDGPTVDDAGVPPKRVHRRPRWHLNEPQSQKVLEAFGR